MEKPFEEWTPVDRERVVAALARILGSRAFSTSPRLQRLLKYLVSETVAGRGQRLHQASIAIDVLERDEHFDPAVDSVVRVEAGRLRSKLRDYYHEEGRNDRVRIELPKGQYRPVVTFIDEMPLPETGPRTVTSVPPMPFAAEKRPGRAIAVVLAIVVIVAVFIARREQQEMEPAAPPATGAAEQAEPDAPDGERSLAVLPFANSSAASEDSGFFADGLHDDLLTQLARIADLKVISRTSVMAYRGVRKPVPQIAEELGVHAVLEGAVQRAGNRVRVNVQLIDGHTDEHLWAQSFDQELTASNVFDIQRRIALQIAGALQARLSQEERNRLAVLPTDNFQAYEAYLKGRQRLVRRTVEDIRAAAQLFEEATRLDPEFALAQTGIAESYYILNSYGGIEEEAMLEVAKPALDRAFALDDRLGEAWTVRGGILALEGDGAGAEEAYRRAIDLNPSHAQAYHWYSMLLIGSPERAKERLTLARRARELDPLSPLLRVNLAVTLENLGRFNEAEAELRRSLEIDPGYPMTSATMGVLYLVGRHDVPEAMRWLARAYSLDSSAGANVEIAEAYLILGDKRGAQPWMERFRASVENEALQEMWAGYMEYVFGDYGKAASQAHSLLERPDNYVKQQMRLLLHIARNDDLAHGRVEEAREHYRVAYPELFAAPPRVTRGNMRAAVDLALVEQKAGEPEHASALLDGAGAALAGMSRLGTQGYSLADAEIAALRGEKAEALAALRAAVESGWRFYWVDRPDRNPNLALLHGDPEYKALMEQVLASLAAQVREVRALERAGQVPLLTAAR
jgi:TolB-like protein/Flp pilus assembly protein TadD